jgi:TRAP transporter 4TM/12TM fusion protein
VKKASVITVIGVAWSLFQIYVAVSTTFPAIVQRGVHVAFALALAFAVNPLGKDKKYHWSDGVLIVISLSVGIFMVLHGDRIGNRTIFVDKPLMIDITMGSITMLLVLEAGRRTAGWAMTLLASSALAYGFLGKFLPGLLWHRGLTLSRMAEAQYLSTQGMLGTPIGVSASYVYYFLILATFLQVTGGGQLFIDMALRITGKMRGGPAKAASLASGLMGSINGSAVANVVGTGIFTIPLMKKVGLSPVFAGAVEAAASTGGQLIPPVMGAAAFIMAEIIGVPYSEIVLAAIIPAGLYYFAVLVMIDLKARKEDLSGLTEDEMPNLKKELSEKGLTLLPLFFLVYLIFSGKSLMTAAFYSVLLLVALAMLRTATRLKLTDFVQALGGAAEQAIHVAIPCALAGIVIGVLSFSGLGLKFTSIIIDISGGNLVAVMLLVAVGCIILGMGMPTTSAYIMAAVLLAPALQNLDVVPIAAHMFVFYFAIMSMVTPPVALASYAAAGIAKADINKTGWQAFGLALSGVLIPFAFVFSPSLLLIGSWQVILMSTATAILGIVCLSIGIIGWFGDNISVSMRTLFAVASILLIIPGWSSDAIGLLLFSLLVAKRLTVYLKVKTASVR